MRRLFGEPEPWSGDPILQAYRFTNVYRVTDRVSQYLISEVQYRSDRKQSSEEVVFRTLLFKIFNRIETWEFLEHQLGPISWAATKPESLLAVLNEAYSRKYRLYSSAYIMPVPPFGEARKHANHVAQLWKMMGDKLPSQIERARSLEQVYETILSFAGIGRFLAFQYTIDINYSSILPFSESEFVVAGPGAIDGISKCFGLSSAASPESTIYRVVERQVDEFKERGLDFPGLFGRPLQPIDCQNLFCEISKYARVAHPEVSGTAGRTRIKQRFQAADRVLAPPFFPPRWNLQPGIQVRDTKRQAELF